MIKAILFDHDGTLVDSETIHFSLWNKVLQPYKTSITKSEYDQFYIGVPTPVCCELIVAKHRLKLAAETLYQAKMQLTKAYLEQQAFPLMPYAKQVIQRLKHSGFTIGIVTGTSRAEISKTIKTYNLHSYLSTVVTRDDVKQSKPHPESYRLAVKSLGLKAKECIAIEDTEAGLASATAAGIKTLVLNDNEQPFAKAEAIVKNLDGVRRYLETNYFTAVAS